MGLRLPFIAWALLLCLAGSAASADQDAAWQALTDQGISVGLDATDMKTLVGRCRQAGLAADEVHPFTESLFRYCERDLPPDPVLDKIEEGLAKRAKPDQIARAADLRGELLERANDLLHTHRPDDLRGHLSLIAATAFALESGVPDTELARLLTDPHADRPGRLRAAIEGLESLHRRNFPTGEACRLMQECLERDYRRYEILAVIDTALRRQSEGIAPAAITAAIPERDAAPPQQRGPGHGRPDR